MQVIRVAEKIYRGERTPQGVNVTVNGRPLQHIVRHSPTGFEFGYGGSGPADLAYSILCDCIGKDMAELLYQRFKWAYVARWGDSWEIGETEIREWIRRGSDA
jgi:hypothetical protein